MEEMTGRREINLVLLCNQIFAGVYFSVFSHLFADWLLCQRILLERTGSSVSSKYIEKNANIQWR